MPGNRFNAFQDHGVGIGLRIPHYQHIFAQKPVVDWFEIISENFMIDAGQAASRARSDHRALPRGAARRFHVLRLGDRTRSRAPAPAQATGAAHRNAVAERPPLLGSVDGTYTHDLLPLPYTWEAVERTVERVRMVQDYLEIPVAVENVSSYAAFTSPK